MTFTPADVLLFMRRHTLALQSSVSPSGAPQAAIVGFAVGDDFQIVFDTVASTRKVVNLLANGRIAFVIGGWAHGDERTVQYEGVADRPTGSELDRLKQMYFARFPDGRDRERWPGIIYFRARPTWIRFSDFNQTPPLVVELTSSQLRVG